MAAKLDGVANQQADACALVIGRLRLLHNERTSKVAPTIGCAATNSQYMADKVFCWTYKTKALANARCVYPAMLEETVVNDTVKPTDCAFTSQNETSLPQVLERGRYARHAAETVHRILATVAVNSRASYQSIHDHDLVAQVLHHLQFRTFRTMTPLMMSATICVASPTDFNSVVLVVENPISSMIMVEKELTTPFGIALHG